MVFLILYYNGDRFLFIRLICGFYSMASFLENEAFLLEYLSVVIFIFVCLVIGLGLLLSSFLVARRSPDLEKLSPYECGFPPFDDARMRFDVRFYLVAILFIIFDLEIAFLFPWALSFYDAGFFGFLSMLLFLFVLTVGYIYEWRKGALEWN